MSRGDEDGTGFERIGVVDALVGGGLDVVITGAEVGAGVGAPVCLVAVMWSGFGPVPPDGCMGAIVVTADR
jgi:hypothetical protein